jgi:hypothetical protein
MNGLPTPVTNTDQFLAAVLHELQGLRSDLTDARGGEAPQQELTEPAVSPARAKRSPSARKP